ncbi:MAG: hypothetical protein IT391_16840 [Nitrospira sp.]|nr:hypothetical protein [Nitrospira sp.]
MTQDATIQKQDATAARRTPSQNRTKVVTVKNNGADDKFSIAVACETADGGHYTVYIADTLAKGDGREVDVSHLALKITRAMVFWRDRNGIGRYTCAKQAQPGSFFLSLLGWWLTSSDATVEENFLSGNEVYP